jgi:hypothetical protein
MSNTATRTFERQPCGRCGGCGEYSYCQRFGTECFGCHGKGTVLTRRGRAANDYAIALMSRRADTVEPGQTMRDDLSRRFVTVERVAVDIATRQAVLYTTRGSFSQFPDTMIRIGHSAEAKVEIVAKAIAYEDTLTKAGTVRKRRTRKAS